MSDFVQRESGSHWIINQLQNNNTMSHDTATFNMKIYLK